MPEQGVPRIKYDLKYNPWSATPGLGGIVGQLRYHRDHLLGYCTPEQRERALAFIKCRLRRLGVEDG